MVRFTVLDYINIRGGMALIGIVIYIIVKVLYLLYKSMVILKKEE
jgi:hypothetical protein